eukprot:scaffold537_cov180-Ochromonas_danica.AAC.25
MVAHTHIVDWDDPPGYPNLVDGGDQVDQHIQTSNFAAIVISESLVSQHVKVVVIKPSDRVMTAFEKVLRVHLPPLKDSSISIEDA